MKKTTQAVALFSSEMNNLSDLKAVKPTTCTFFKWNKQLKQFKSSKTDNLHFFQVKQATLAG